MQRVRLAELCASTSLFTDLGTGQPVEHGLRTCLVAMRLAAALGLDDDTRREVLYVSLLRFLGCTADAHVVAEMAEGDETVILAGAAPVYFGSPREEMTRILSLVGRGASVPRRLRALARALADPGGGNRLMQAHCEVASRLAEEMSLPAGVPAALEVAYARWDGKGVPAGLGGEDIPASVRVAIVARDVELWTREAGPEAAMETLGERRGRAYDPAAVDAALGLGPEELRRSGDDLWDMVVAAEPTPWSDVTGPDIDRALIALGDFADLKIPAAVGHSRRVRDLVAIAGEDGLRDEEDRRVLVRAGAIHDLGLVAVPVGALKEETQSATAREQMRMHPIWTQRILDRCGDLAPIGALAGRHHECLDGSGYPAGTVGDIQGDACLLASAEMYDELLMPGRGRPALTAAAAAQELSRQASRGAISPDDAKAVLEAAGVAAPLIETRRPAGLTEREVDVLVLLARGESNRQVAGRLGISPKTVGTHIEHIYAKAGVTTRAAATLFAVQNGLV